MSKPEDMTRSKETVARATAAQTPSAPPTIDVENPTPTTGKDAAGTVVNKRTMREMLKKCSLILRLSGFLFSFIAFVVMVSNRHGNMLNFDNYEEYSYVLAIAIMSSVYTATQGIRQVVQLFDVKNNLHRYRTAFAIVDFVGDQIFAYLLISAASAAVPLTNRSRDGYSTSTVKVFIDTAAGAISMSFLAFFVLAVSAIISGYQLCTLSQI